MGSNFLAVMIGAALSGIYTSIHGYFEKGGHPEYVWYVMAGHLLIAAVVFWAFIRLAGEFGEQKA